MDNWMRFSPFISTVSGKIEWRWEELSVSELAENDIFDIVFSSAEWDSFLNYPRWSNPEPRLTSPIYSRTNGTNHYLDLCILLCIESLMMPLRENSDFENQPPTGDSSSDSKRTKVGPFRPWSNAVNRLREATSKDVKILADQIMEKEDELKESKR